MESNWGIQKSKSKYHFNPLLIDPIWDKITNLGSFIGDWSSEVEQTIKTARPATWRDRSYDQQPNKLVDAEENDLKKAGIDPKTVISNLEYNLSPSFQKMCDLIGLENSTNRVHVQWPGQVFTIHIDKLEKVFPEDPSRVMRIMVMLTDYEQGHFMQFGNYTMHGWRNGDIYTFDWQNLPHSSANASLVPRVSMLTTGVITDKTKTFLENSSRQFKI